MRVVAFGGDAGLDALLADKPATYDDVATSSDDVALLAFTSGTTGRPKATMHFHRDVLAICDTFSRHVLRPAPDDVFTGTPPYAFTFGLGGVLLFPLHAGASTVLVEKATPVELAAIIDDFGVTTCFTAPTAYKAMLAAGATLPSLTARRLGGRAPAGGDLAGVPRRDRRADHRRDRRDRDAAHLHLRGRRRHPCRGRPVGRCRATPRPCSTTTAPRRRRASPGGWR